MSQMGQSRRFAMSASLPLIARAAGVEVSDVVGFQAWASHFACPRAAFKAITCRSSRSD